MPERTLFRLIRSNPMSDGAARAWSANGRLCLMVSFSIALLFGESAFSQHCAPIYESYLSSISVKHRDNTLAFQIDYAKNGGRPMDSYQGYLVAYLEKDREAVLAPAPHDLIDERKGLILHTQRMPREPEGDYQLEFAIDVDALARKMIEYGHLTVDDRTAHGGWGVYNDKIRIAVFVPFLEDTKYSTIEGLPEDRHECNYADDRALLFQELPYALSIHFGIVQAYKLKDGQFYIEINGDKPPVANQ